MENKSLEPTIKWAERKDKLYVTIELTDVKDPKIDITDDNVLKFNGTSDGKAYSLELPLFGEVNKEESKWTLDTRNIFLNIHKKTKGAHWNFINKDKKKYNHIKVDWQLYIDEDEEDEQANANMGGFPGMMGGNNFMNMGDMMQHEDVDEDDIKDEEDNKEDKLDDLDKPNEA